MQRYAAIPQTSFFLWGLEGVARWVVPGLLLLGMGLRLAVMGRPGIHPDEALYASWALRIADGSDPALLGVHVDKPPLLLYLLAGLFRLGGAGPEQIAGRDLLISLGRLSGLIASALSMGLLFAIARRVYGRPVGILSLALFAVSPLAVRLSPTLLTDPWLVLWLLLGLWAALERRSWLAGLACGLAYATKQQGILIVPLVLLTWRAVETPLKPSARSLHVAAWVGASPTSRPSRRDIWRLLNGFLLVAAVVLWWDSLRWQWMPSYWDRSLENYGGLALVAGSEVIDRLVRWGEPLSYVFGSPVLSVALLAGLPIVFFLAWQRRRNQAGRFDLVLLTTAAGYLVAHVAVTFAPWDRYVLPLVPMLALLLARVLEWLLASAREEGALGGSQIRRLALLGILLIGLAHGASLAVSRHGPVGNATAYDGVSTVAAHMQKVAGQGPVLYHRQLGWHYGFFLYGEQEVELRWWEKAEDLAALATVDTDRAQYVAFPTGGDRPVVQSVLRASGLRLMPELRARHADGSPSLTLYRLQRAPDGATRNGR